MPVRMHGTFAQDMVAKVTGKAPCLHHFAEQVTGIKSFVLVLCKDDTIYKLDTGSEVVKLFICQGYRYFNYTGISRNSQRPKSWTQNHANNHAKNG